MGKFEAALEAVQEDPPMGILAVELKDANNLLVILEDSSDEFTIMMPDNYMATYPKGEVSAMIGVNFEDLGEGPLPDLLEKFADKVQRYNLAQCREYTSMSYGSYEEEEEDYTAGMQDRPMHAQLAADIERVRRRFGRTAVTVSELKGLDEVVVCLELNVQYLPATVCSAWGLAPKVDAVPLTVKVTFNRSSYTEVSKATVLCYQRGREWCGLAGQLQRMLKTFLNDALTGRAVEMKLPDDLKRLTQLGYPLHRCRAALSAADGNQQRAANMLAEDAAALDTMPAGEQRPKGVAPLPDGKAAEEADAVKAIPERIDGLLVQIMDYAHQRIPTICSYCVICDNKHLFNAGGFLKASVCRADLCAFAFQTLGLGSDAAQDLATDAGVVDLLVTMAKAAANSARWKLIFSPYPTIFDSNDSSKKILDRDNQDIDKVRRIMSSFPAIKAFSEGGGSTLDATARLQKDHPHAMPLLNWIISSNTSHLVKIPHGKILKRVGTPHQYLLLSSPPEQQAQFDKLKRRHGRTVFAFHGSRVENWHSILRNGLYNASGTAHQCHGAAYGSGIYLSPQASVSYGYSEIRGVAQSTEVRQQRNARAGDVGAWLADDVRCVAICECIDHQIKKATGAIWVQPNSSHVVTRFFMVFDSQHPIAANLDSEEPEFAQELHDLVAEMSS